MNLFILDQDFDANARAHVDRHVTKIQLEAAQILCTALNLPHMKPTHRGHPCVKWAARAENALWVAHYGQALNREYNFRYNKPENYKIPRQVFAEVIKKFEGLLGKPKDFVLAMPDEFRKNCPFESYRAYYRGAKQHLFLKKNKEHCWTKRQIPVWLNIK